VCSLTLTLFRRERELEGLMLRVSREDPNVRPSLLRLLRINAGGRPPHYRLALGHEPGHDV
jgi:hypothetical protein